MPGYDGTGPAGMGQMTGGGRGNCRRDTPYARMGFGRRGGRGFGRRNGFGFRGGPRYFQNDGTIRAPRPLGRKEEAVNLKDEAEHIENLAGVIREKAV